MTQPRHAALADEIGKDLGAVLTIKHKGALYGGLRSCVRCGWVIDRTTVGDKPSNDPHTDINSPIR